MFTHAIVYLHERKPGKLLKVRGFDLNNEFGSLFILTGQPIPLEDFNRVAEPVLQAGNDRYPVAVRMVSIEEMQRVAQELEEAAERSRAGREKFEKRLAEEAEAKAEEERLAKEAEAKALTDEVLRKQEEDEERTRMALELKAAKELNAGAEPVEEDEAPELKNEPPNPLE